MNVLDNFDVVKFKPKYMDVLTSMLEQSFGEIARLRGALDKKFLKYYSLVFDDGEPVAVSGILPAELSLFDGYEVSWTCTSPKYRHGGICTELLRHCILELPNDGVPVFCDCWRFLGGKINLFHAMNSNGFELVVPEASVYSTGFSRLCSVCPYRRSGDFGCRCYVDVWKLPRIKV